MSDMKIGFEMRKIRLPLDGHSARAPDQGPPEEHHVDTAPSAPPSRKSAWSSRWWSIRRRALRENTCCWTATSATSPCKELGETEADCIIASDDESFTYNARVNRLNPIAEHKMIMKAVQNGVRPERIAAALNMSVRDVKASMSLLDGINEEAADLLKDKAISPKAIRLLQESHRRAADRNRRADGQRQQLHQGLRRGPGPGHAQRPTGQPRRAEDKRRA